MQPLEQVTILLTLMRRLGQLMDHERALLGSLRLESLTEIQDEKAALAEAYGIELDRLRRNPETLAALEVPVRERLHEAMRGFQESLAANLDALIDAHLAAEEILHNIADSLMRGSRGLGAETRAGAHDEPRGHVIQVAFGRNL